MHERCSAAGQNFVSLYNPCRTLDARAATCPVLTQHPGLHIKKNAVLSHVQVVKFCCWLSCRSQDPCQARTRAPMCTCHWTLHSSP